MVPLKECWTFGHAVVKPVKEFEVESDKSAFDDTGDNAHLQTRQGVVQ